MLSSQIIIIIKFKKTTYNVKNKEKMPDMVQIPCIVEATYVQLRITLYLWIFPRRYIFLPPNGNLESSARLVAQNRIQDWGKEGVYWGLSPGRLQ